LREIFGEKMWKNILKSDEQVLRNFLAETAKKYEGKRYNVVVINPQYMEEEGNKKIYDAFESLYRADRERLNQLVREYFRRNSYAAADYQGQSGVYYIDI
tara:strand:+ start:3384 stop:3683 length:300 start_codon:yes stop_codon:yes gene_type:complete